MRYGDDFMKEYFPKNILDKYPIYKNDTNRSKIKPGDIYKDLTIKYRTLNSGKNNNIINFLTQCTCGNYRVVASRKLIEGIVTKCSQCVKDMIFNQAKEKEIGKRYGEVVVIDYYKISGTTLDRKPRYYATIKCDCGEIETHIEISRLRRGEVTKCYKHRRIAENLIGQIFDHLIVIGKVKKEDQIGDSCWLCECKCGNIVTRATKTLKNPDHYHSCGCVSVKSRGELKIQELLIKNKIPFVSQKSFLNFNAPNNRPYLFDFYIDNNFILEFDGEQHYHPVELFGGEQGYLQRKNNDRIKNEYCLSNNIPIKRIPYWILDILTIEDIMSDNYLIKEENFS